MPLPDNLTSLPTAPYAERPMSVPLTIQEVRTALWRCRGNISKAAELLKVPSSRLRSFVKNSPYLSGEAAEAREELADRAEDILYEALNDHEDPQRRDQMARFVLTQIGASRGFGRNNSARVNINTNGNVVIQWADGGSVVGNDEVVDENTIEGKVVDG